MKQPDAGEAANHMDSVTTFLAVWGAVVSTIAIGWHIFRDLGDRGRIRVLCYVGEIVGGGGPPDPTPKFVYNVTNTGRRPILVTHIGGSFPNGNHFMVTTRVPLPRMLQPGEYFLEFAEDLSVLDKKPSALWAIDSLGKYWKIPEKQLQFLLNQHQERQLQRAR